MRTFIFCLAWACIPVGTSPRLLAADAVTPERCRELQESLMAFYLPSVDTTRGGYLEELDAEGKFSGSEKFLTLQARQLWYFSMLADHGINRDKALEAAKSGYDFLVGNFHDRENGGYIAKTSRDGTPIDTRKHVYPNAFVIYGLVAYHRATGDVEPLERAQRLFRTLEQHCYDQEFGGYREFFYDDWRLITDPSESGYVGAINTKTYNSHLHILEAWTQLYNETKDPLVAERLVELIQINTVTVKHPDHPCNVDGWNPDWTLIETEQNLRTSYGHDVECAWLVLEAGNALGRKPATMRNWAETICEHSIKYGYDRAHGGFFASGPLSGPSDDRRKIWWTQAEAMVAMLVMHRLTGDEKYREIFEDSFRFVEQYHLAKDGGWWATLEADGTLGQSQVRTSMWQGAYHNGRALLICERLLRGN